MFFKIIALKNLANFTGKHLCWSLFLIKLQAFEDLFLKNTCGDCFCFVKNFTYILRIFSLGIVPVPDSSRPISKIGFSSAITNTVHLITQTLKVGKAIFEIKSKNFSRRRKFELSNMNIYRFFSEETSKRVIECFNKVLYRVRLSDCSNTQKTHNDIA